jgi:hypothetical protein
MNGTRRKKRMDIEHLDTLVWPDKPQPKQLYNKIMECLGEMSSKKLINGGYYFKKNWIELKILDSTILNGGKWTYYVKITHYLESRDTRCSYRFYYNGSKQDKDEIMRYSTRTMYRTSKEPLTEPWEVL